jgi:hypothetical protein
MDALQGGGSGAQLVTWSSSMSIAFLAAKSAVAAATHLVLPISVAEVSLSGKRIGYPCWGCPSAAAVVFFPVAAIIILFQEAGASAGAVLCL